MKKIGSILIILLTATFGIAQKFSDSDQKKLDRYHSIIEDPNSHDTALASAYVNMGEIMAQADFSTVEPLSQKAVAVAEAALLKDQPEEVIMHLTKSLALAKNNLGLVVNAEGRIDESLELLEESLRLRRRIGDAYGIAEALGNIGNVWSTRGDFSKALEYSKEAYEFAKEIENENLRQKSMGGAEGNMAMMYQMAGENDQAFKFARRAVKSCSKAGFQFGVSQFSGTIGGLHEDEGRLDSALFYLNKQKEGFAQFENELGVSMSSYALGRVHFKMGEFETAIENYSSQLTISSELNNHILVSQAQRNIGQAYSAMSQRIGVTTNEKSTYLKLAQENLEQSLKIAEEIGHLIRMKFAAEDLTEVYTAQGRISEAFDMYKKYIQIMDSLDSDAKEEAFAREQFKFEYEKQKAVDNANHEKELAVAAEREEKQKLYTYSIAGGLGLSALFLFVVFNRLRVTRKQKEIIEDQKQEVEEAHKEITDSIHYAKRIQAAVLPPDSIVKQHLPGSFILYKPKDIVAGDFYWLEEKNGTVFFASADCTGHGVPGAMVSVVCVSGLNRSLREMNITEPGKILDKTRELVVKEFEKSDENVQDGMDIALCSLKGKTLQYAGAHNPLWIVRNGELMETKADKQPIGKYDNPQPYATHTVELQEGDSLYIFSDGYPDQFGGEQGKKYKSGKFKQFLTSIADEPIRDQKKLLDREFEGWRGSHEQIDDVCVIGVKV